LETDAAEDKKPKISGVAFTDADCTLNVNVNSRNMLSCLSEGGMQFLLAGARANAGIKSGRYMFEIRIIELHNRSGAVSQGQGQPPSRPSVRVGFAHAGGCQLMTGDAESSISFDMDGYMYVGKSKKKVAKDFRRDAVVAVLLNLDPSSPNKNTISLFREGMRICEPQPIPEALLAKPLFPAINFKSASIQVNFGPAPLVPLPFKCHMVGAAAKGDAEVVAAPKAKQQEIVFPIGLPEQGFFDFVDAFLAKHPDYIELSDRMILDWAVKSGLTRPKAAGSVDKPLMQFGVPQMDDNSVRRVLRQVASMSNRSFVVPELQANLIASERKAVLKRFALPTFKKVARVVIGEPSSEHKAKVQELVKQDKLRVAEAERRKKAAEAERMRLLEERKKKLELAKKPKTDDAEAAKDEAKDQAETEKVAEEPLVVELTDEEKALWYRRQLRAEVAEGVIAKTYANFTLPSKEEGFDQIVYEWQNEAAAATVLKEWISAKKMTQRVEDLKPGEAFTQASQAWAKTLSEWKNLQSQWKDPNKKKALLAKRKEAKAKEGEEKGETPAAEEMDINFEDLDVETVADVADIGTGEPLFSNFMYEDWQLLTVRRELLLLVNSFKKDLNDPERTGFGEKDLSFYYQKYFKRAFSLQNFNCQSLQALVDLIPDTLSISPETKFLEAVQPDDIVDAALVKIVETQRRDRQRRLDAGDESAELKFPRAAQAPITRPTGGAPWQSTKGGKGVVGAGKFPKGVGKGPVQPGVQRPMTPLRPQGTSMIGQKRPAPPATAPSAWAAKKPRMAWGQ